MAINLSSTSNGTGPVAGDTAAMSAAVTGSVRINESAGSVTDFDVTANLSASANRALGGASACSSTSTAATVVTGTFSTASAGLLELDFSNLGTGHSQHNVNITRNAACPGQRRHRRQHQRVRPDAPAAGGAAGRLHHDGAAGRPGRRHQPGGSARPLGQRQDQRARGVQAVRSRRRSVLGFGGEVPDPGRQPDVRVALGDRGLHEEGRQEGRRRARSRSSRRRRSSSTAPR